MAKEGGDIRLLGLMTIVAAPLALTIETVMRKLFAPAEFEEVRGMLNEFLTPVAWAFVGLTLLLGLLGLALQRKWSDRAVNKLPEDQRSAARVSRARGGAFMLSASVAQVPAVIVTVLFTLGASWIPVVVAVAISTISVIVQALRIPSMERSS